MPLNTTEQILYDYICHNHNIKDFWLEQIENARREGKEEDAIAQEVGDKMMLVYLGDDALEDVEGLISKIDIMVAQMPTIVYMLMGRDLNAELLKMANVVKQPSIGFKANPEPIINSISTDVHEPVSNAIDKKLSKGKAAKKEHIEIRSALESLLEVLPPSGEASINEAKASIQESQRKFIQRNKEESDCHKGRLMSAAANVFQIMGSLIFFGGVAAAIFLNGDKWGYFLIGLFIAMGFTGISEYFSKLAKDLHKKFWVNFDLKEEQKLRIEFEKLKIKHPHAKLSEEGTDESEWQAYLKQVKG